MKSSVVFCCTAGFWHPFSVSPSLSVLSCLFECNKATIICQIMYNLNSSSPSCWFTSHSAFNNFIDKSVVKYEILAVIACVNYEYAWVCCWCGLVERGRMSCCVWICMSMFVGVDWLSLCVNMHEGVCRCGLVGQSSTSCSRCFWWSCLCIPHPLRLVGIAWMSAIYSLCDRY